MTESNSKDYSGDFERLKKQWNSLQKDKKTPAYFLNLFTAAGNIDNTAELKIIYQNIEDLLQTQNFTTAEKDDLTKQITEMITPELRKDYTPYDLDTFIKDIKDYDPSKEFVPENMKDVIFQHGTFNLIAARPSRGKTTLTVSLMTEALNNSNLAKEKTPVLYLTFEESNKQIYTRIFNNLLFKNSLKIGSIKNIQTEHPRARLWNALKDPNNPDYETIAYQIETVKKTFSDFEKSKRLQVIDCGGKSISSIENLLSFNKNAIVFIDYVTLIQQDKEESINRYEDFADISVRLVESAKTNNQIIIGAAQLRRLGQNATDSDKPDDLNDTQLKDCGQLEQDANTIIALGRDTDHKDQELADHDKGQPIYFWKLLKNRDGGGVNKSYLFKTADNSMGFSLLQSTIMSGDFLNDKKVIKDTNTTEQKNKSNKEKLFNDKNIFGDDWIK
jgi:hypothetical protein